MIKSIIVEDDPIYSKQLFDLLLNYNKQIEILSICRNVEEALIAISRFNPELIFLDIELEKGETGFDLFKKVDKINFNVIFTTSHINEHINEIRICGIGFIVKPYISHELDEVVNKYLNSNRPSIGIERINTLKGNLQTKSSDDKFIWIPNGSRYDKVEINNILYCKSDDPVTYFHLLNAIDGKLILTANDSIKDYEFYFKDTSIVRIHNRYLVNIKYIKNYLRGDGGSIMLSNNTSLDVSKSYKQDLLNRLGIRK